MCIAVCCEQDNRSISQYFSHAKAYLPVLNKTGGCVPVTWGRRLDETGNLPAEAGLFLEDIRAGKWDEFFPKPVKLPVKRFAMLKDNGKMVWFELLAEHLVQGVVANFNSERRCYVVLIQTHEPNHPFAYWPRILYRGEQLTLQGCV